MQKTNIIMQSIDYYRKEQKLTIKELVTGINSERNYRRYLYDDLSMPFTIFAKYLERLNIEYNEFVLSSYNEMNMNNIEVFYALSLCIQESYESAKEYLEVVKQNDKHVLGFDSLMEIVDLTITLHDSIITSSEYLDKCGDIFNLDRIFESNIITLQQVYMLVIISKYAPNDIKFKMATLFHKYLTDDTYVILSNNILNVRQLMIENGIRILVSLEPSKSILSILSDFQEVLMTLLEADNYVLKLTFVESLHTIYTYQKSDTKMLNYYFYSLKFMNLGRFISKKDLEVYSIKEYFEIRNASLGPNLSFIDYITGGKNEIN